MQIGVIGGGQMGSGIAQVCAVKGLTVTLCDNSQTQLDKARATIEKFLAKLQSKGKITAPTQEEALANINYVTDLSGLTASEIVIEAVVEDVAVKETILRTIDEIVPAPTILASNTSSIPISRLANFTTRPAKVIGMHFMNPVPLMKLVEIIPTMHTSTETRATIVELARTLGKEAVISQDYPGFIVNRILMPMINEAFDTLLWGVANAQDIDTAMKLGTNQPLGPLALADLIGLDTCAAIMQTMHRDLGDPKYRPSPLLLKYVQCGRLGRKTGEGVYRY